MVWGGETGCVLELDKLNGIQWVYGAGQSQPIGPSWIETLRKIQKTGKLICMEVPANELEWMMDKKEDNRHIISPLHDGEW